MKETETQLGFLSESSECWSDSLTTCKGYFCNHSNTLCEQLSSSRNMTACKVASIAHGTAKQKRACRYFNSHAIGKWQNLPKHKGNLFVYCSSNCMAAASPLPLPQLGVYGKLPGTCTLPAALSLTALTQLYHSITLSMSLT